MKSAHENLGATKADMSKKSHYYYLDLLRGLSAMLVILEHARNFLWVDYPEIANPTILTKLTYFVSGLGHEAVMIFFVLSGCVVGRIPIDALANPTSWKWREYLFARLSRLWIVLVPALLLTWGLDLISISVAPADSFVFVGNGYAHRTADQIVQHQLQLAHFAGNLGFLQTILVPTFGSNGALWSLANEFWYYMAFPLLLFGVAGWQKKICRIIFIIVGLLVLFTFGNIGQAFPIWAIGAAAYYFGIRMQSGRLTQLGFLAGLLLTFSTICLSRLEILDGMLASYSIALSAGATVMFSLSNPMPDFMRSPAKWLSDFSFSLYVVHTPILTLFVAPWLASNADRLQPNSSGILFLIGSILGIYLFSWLFYRAIEHRTPEIRRFIRGRIPYLQKSQVRS
jgi:peptidoglycan/LPS O-acetylase OafA/YrhL